MCFGSGPSAEDIYQKKKPKFGELPSLSITKSKRKRGTMADVPMQREGAKRRTLINPLGVSDDATG